MLESVAVRKGKKGDGVSSIIRAKRNKAIIDARLRCVCEPSLLLQQEELRRSPIEFIMNFYERI